MAGAVPGLIPQLLYRDAGRHLDSEPDDIVDYGKDQDDPGNPPGVVVV